MNGLFWLECFCCLIALGITANTLGNLRAFHRLTEYAAVAADCPFVSVLIPARNEAENIGACLTSLMVQSYPCYEIIVLDDGSEDETALIVGALAGTRDVLRLIRGKPLPEGWLGKAYACHQLAEVAGGAVLIFTDADTVHAPTMIRSVVGAFASGAAVVTAFPAQAIGSWSEALAVPFMSFTVWAFLPIGRVWSDPSPRFVAANGQLLAFTRAAYEQIGGHAAVRRAVLDDMGLAKRAKALRLPVRLADGVGTVRTRMYHDAGEVWRGFSKNAFALTGSSIAGATIFAAVLLLLYVLPPIILLVGSFVLDRGDWTWRILPAALVVLMLIQAGVIAKRTKRPFWQPLVHPFGVILFVLILTNSVLWHWRGRGEWKGRTYATRLPVPDAQPDTAPEER